MRGRRRSAIAVLLCTWFAAVGPAEAVPGERPRLPEPLGYVSDHGGVLDDEWKARIRSVCQDLERKTGVEMVIVTVPELRPYGTANDYAGALYERWGIGSAQQEHGMLVLLAVHERQAAMTIGRRLLPIVTSAVAGRIAADYLDPGIKVGHYGEALYRTAVALASESQEVRIGTLSKHRFRGLGFWITLFTSIGALSFLWWISRPDLRHPYGRIRKGEYWGTGQGGFGGNFGGFGGAASGEGYK